MAIIGLTVEQWSDSHSDFDTGPTLATDSLASEFLTVTSTATYWLLGC